MKKGGFMPKRKVAKLSKPVRAAVKQIVTGRAEKKFVTQFFANPILPTSDILPQQGPIANTASLNTFYPLIPPVANGSGQSERIGDSIRPTHLLVNVTVVATDYTSAIDAVARLFIVEDKTVNSQVFQNPGLPDSTQLLDSGNNPHAYDGTISWHSMPVNKARYKVHVDKTVKIQKTLNYFQNGANTYQSTQPYISPNTFHKLTFRIPLKKVFHYESDLSTVPTNQAVWLACGWTAPNGVSGAALPNTNVSIVITSTLYWTDP